MLIIRNVLYYNSKVLYYNNLSVAILSSHVAVCFTMIAMSMCRTNPMIMSCDLCIIAFHKLRDAK